MPLRWIAGLAALLPLAAPAADEGEARPWVLESVVRPELPARATGSGNPIDAFLAQGHESGGLRPVGPAERRTLLRRVTLDLVGLAPTVEEQDAFLRDEAPGAYERAVDRLLASDQHGVRYARHWLDVLRYADVDERMIAAPGIHHWRDWVIRALNDDVPYDQFVRAQLTGYRSASRTQMSATGVRSKVEPRPDDQFALGCLARGAVFRDGKDARELPIAAVETVSTAFMGLTVGCAKCHDHMYDPISQRDFYAMKALFDPLVLRKVTLASAAEVVAAGRAADEAEQKRLDAQAPIEALIGPYRQKLRDDRVAMLPPEVQAVIRKPEKDRTAAERKVADDYYPILRIDEGKVVEVLTPADREKYRELRSKLPPAGDRRAALPAFWTVEVDARKELEKSYILTSGDPDRPEPNHEIKPGWPFAPADVELGEGRVEGFSDWLTAAENPMFARVAVNRIWQWHFGRGLHEDPSDFGFQGGTADEPKLLDWLAAEFVARGFRMKAIHRLIVTSDAYRRASEVDPTRSSAELGSDPGDAHLWRFRPRRLEAEPIWDAIHAAAGDLDLAVGGPSFDPAGRRGGDRGPSRRAAYMIRGYSTNRDVVPTFLQSFDVDDGRAPCPIRTRTVTAPQSLFLMNSDVVDAAAGKFAERLKIGAKGDLGAAVDLGYRIAVARPPLVAERDAALAYLENDPARLKGLAWLLFNLDEFLYAR